ncbi:MAG: hypothetical protein WCA98_12180 [Candidatus Acidiferrales bacterium]
MQAAIQFTILSFVILGSISLAVLLEWLSLWGLMRLMPATHRVAETRRDASSTRNLPRFVRPGR